LRFTTGSKQSDKNSNLIKKPVGLVRIVLQVVLNPPNAGALLTRHGVRVPRTFLNQQGIARLKSLTRGAVEDDAAVRRGKIAPSIVAVNAEGGTSVRLSTRLHEHGSQLSQRRMIDD
jgi:hypothetical protein